MSDKVKELRLTMRVSNNRMRRRREELGMNTKSAAAAAGIRAESWSTYENLHSRPFGRPGRSREHCWTQTAKKIADTLGVTCEWLWPESTLAVVNPTVVAEIDASDLAPQLLAAQMHPALPTPEQFMLDAEQRGEIEEMLRALTPREQHVIEMRFGFNGEPMSLDDLGREFGVGRERVRQLQERALRRIREFKARRTRGAA